MPEQSLLQCVSCESTYDPTPNGGFCPDCDTPHPEYGHQDTANESPADEAAAAESDEDETATSAPEVAGDGGAVQAAETDDSEADATEEAASTSSSVDAESTVDADAGDDERAVDESETVCPDCGAVFVPDTATGTVGSDELDEDAGSAADDLTACPDCGHSITDESYCPSCGTHLDPIRTAEEATDDADEAAAEDADVAADGDAAGADEVTAGADEDAAGADEDADGADEDAAETAEGEGDEVPDSLTLVIDGESYTFEDGDTFGRQDADWLDDLVTASGGSDAVAYISGEHLQFSIEDDGVYVTDVSRNGTELNGTELDGGKAKLEDGDTLDLAERARVDVII